MEAIFGNWNVIQILGVGLSGLALLLMVLAYRLLTKVIDNPNPTGASVSLVKFYLGLTVAVLIIVGVFSLPLLGKNQELAVEKNELIKDTTKLAADKKVLVITNEVNQRLDTIKQAGSAIEVKEQLDKIKVATQDLPQAVTVSAPSETGRVADFQHNINLEITTVNQRIKANDTNIVKAPLKKSLYKLKGFSNKLSHKVTN